MTGLREDEWEARMAALSPEAITVAEDVWTEDEPTLAEYELTERILAARAAQTDAAAALDEVLERLSERREEEWGNYIGGPGGHVEALLQGRFDGLVVACAIVRDLRAALTSEPQP